MTLNATEVPGSYYAKSLRLVPKVAWPNIATNYRIQYIIKEKTVNKRTMAYVKWEHFPLKMASWVDKANFVPASVTD